MTHKEIQDMTHQQLTEAFPGQFIMFTEHLGEGWTGVTLETAFYAYLCGTIDGVWTGQPG